MQSVMDSYGGSGVATALYHHHRTREIIDRRLLAYLEKVKQSPLIGDRDERSPADLLLQDLRGDDDLNFVAIYDEVREATTAPSGATGGCVHILSRLGGAESDAVAVLPQQAIEEVGSGPQSALRLGKKFYWPLPGRGRRKQPYLTNFQR